MSVKFGSRKNSSLMIKLENVIEICRERTLGGPWSVYFVLVGQSSMVQDFGKWNGCVHVSSVVNNVRKLWSSIKYINPLSGSYHGTNPIPLQSSILLPKIKDIRVLTIVALIEGLSFGFSSTRPKGLSRLDGCIFYRHPNYILITSRGKFICLWTSFWGIIQPWTFLLRGTRQY